MSMTGVTVIQWGLLDTKDNLWIGNSEGPLLYTDQTINGKLMPGKLLAQLAAHTACARTGWPLTRVRERIFNERNCRHKDDVTPIRSAEEALEKLEKGYM